MTPRFCGGLDFGAVNCFFSFKIFSLSLAHTGRATIDLGRENMGCRRKFGGKTKTRSTVAFVQRGRPVCLSLSSHSVHGRLGRYDALYACCASFSSSLADSASSNPSTDTLGVEHGGPDNRPSNVR